MMSKSTMWSLGIMISLTSGSLGFGLSQQHSIQPLEREVATQIVEMKNLKDAFQQEQVRTDNRITKVVNLVEAANALQRESVTQTTRLVDTITFQNKLLQDSYKLIQDLSTKKP